MESYLYRDSPANRDGEKRDSECSLVDFKNFVQRREINGYSRDTTYQQIGMQMKDTENVDLSFKEVRSKALLLTSCKIRDPVHLRRNDSTETALFHLKIRLYLREEI